jgi:hypothetical protein
MFQIVTNQIQYLYGVNKQTSVFGQLIIILSVILLLPSGGFAQEYMGFGSDDDTSDVETNLLVEAQILRGSKPFKSVEVFVLNEKGKVILKDTTNANGYFSVKLNFDSVYVLAFIKENYITKKVEIDTRHMPEEDKAFGYDLGLFKLSMLQASKSVSQSLYLKPVARFRYNEVTQIFIVDRAYKKEVKKKFEEKGEKPEIIKF